jgi:hypothetical protein
MNTILQEAISDFRSHTIERNTIRDPGRFEGETLLTVYCDHLEGNGCGGECLSFMEDGMGEYASLFDVDEEFRKELAEAGYQLETDTVAVLYTASEQGFISTHELTAAQRDRIVAEYEDMAEEEESDD